MSGSVAASIATNTTGTTGAVNTPANSTIVVSVGWYSGTPHATTPLVDNKGNTYTISPVGILTGNDALFKSADYICVNATGGTGHTWTPQWAAAPGGGGSFVIAVAGVLTASPLDRSAGAKDTHTDATPYASPATAATTQADEIAIAFGHTYTNTAGPESHSWNNGYSNVDTLTDPATWTGASGYKVLSATGAQTASLNASGATATDALVSVYTLKATASVATDQPRRRPMVGLTDSVREERPQRARPLLPVASAPVADDPFLALWGDRGEGLPAEDRPRRPRAPVASGAAVASGPPLFLRRLPQESQGEDTRQRRRGVITPVDPPPIELRRVPFEVQPEEPPRRLRAPVPPPDVTPGDQPPNRARFRAEEFQQERPIQRIEIPWPPGAAPVGDAPPLLARKRPEETQGAELTQRRGVPPADAAPVPDAPPVRVPRPLEAVASEERPRARLVPPVALAADPPPLRRWIRVEETQADETRPRRFLVYVAPTPADAPPLPARRVPFELALSEPVQRRRVTPPNAPIVPGDLPVFRPGRTPLERAIEERPQRRLMRLAGPSAIVQFNPRFTVKAPAHSRTAKAPASSRKAKAYPRR